MDANGVLSLLLTSSALIVTGVDAQTRAHALDDGRVLWTSPTGGDTEPVLSGTSLILAAGSELTALDLATGERRWSVTLAGTTLGASIGADRVYVAAGPTLAAYRTTDGSQIWTATTGALSVAAAAASDTIVAVALDDRTLAAFDPASGRALWRVTLPVTPTLIVANTDRVYFGTKENFACAYHAATGQRDWCYPVRVTPVGRAALDAEHVYWAFLDNTVRVFDRRNGARRQSVALNARPLDGPQLGGTQLIVPLVTGEFVFFTPGDTFTPTRFDDPAAKVAPPLMQASAVAPDGSSLAMLTVSPTGRSLVMFASTAPPATAKPAGTTATTTAK